MHPEKPEFESQPDPVLNTEIVLKMCEKLNKKKSLKKWLWQTRFLCEDLDYIKAEMCKFISLRTGTGFSITNKVIVIGK